MFSPIPDWFLNILSVVIPLVGLLIPFLIANRSRLELEMRVSRISGRLEEQRDWKNSNSILAVLDEGIIKNLRALGEHAT